MKRKDVFVSAIKGIITGVTLWISNISIGSMIFSTSSYENVVKGFASIPKKDNKELWRVAIPIFIGICIGLLGGFHLISYFYGKYQLQTIILLIGFFVGGIRTIFKSNKLCLNKKNAFIPLIVLTISILLIIVLNGKVLSIKSDILQTLCVGLITGISIIIPSFTSLIKHIGKGYTVLLNSLNNILSIDSILIIIVFVVILILSILAFAKLIKKLIDKNRNNLYLAICSCVLVNIVLLVMQIKPFTINFVNIFTSILAFLWGYLFAKNVEKE